MGAEASQTHTFPCRHCKESVTIRMDIDYDKIETHIHCLENCKPSEEQADAVIVNVDANFLIPESDQGKDRVFPRLQQMHEMFEATKKAGGLVDLGKIPEKLRQTRPYRKPDYADEWRSLKKAWSLHRNGKADLSQAILRKASGQFYAADPLNDLPDWLWRFAMFVCQPHFEQPFRDALELIQPLYGTSNFSSFGEDYKKLVPKRGERYVAVMADFFTAFSDFSQVYFLVAKGMPIPGDYKATSANFEATKMFYGNAYEHFAKSIEYLALVNNMLRGRTYDTFENLSLEEYRKLDNPARFNAFAATDKFAAICAEADNQIRNASHHGSFSFDQDGQIIRYRSGKGGTGPERQIAYVDYLERCVRLFLQLMTLLRIELMVAHQAKLAPPV